MKRTALFLAVLAAGCLILLSLAATSAHTGSAWRALGESEFRSLVPAATNSPVTLQQPTPAATPVVAPTHLATPTTRPCCASSTVTAKGWATYQPGTGLWGSPSQLVYDWTGSHVRVCGPLACRSIETRGWCACGERHGERTLIDLSEEAFAAICGYLSRGVCDVVVTR